MKIQIQEETGTTWVMGVVHWTSYGALQVSPDTFEHNKSEKGWEYRRFFPHCTKVPFIYSADRAALATSELIEALLHPHPEAPLEKLVKISWKP